MQSGSNYPKQEVKPGCKTTLCKSFRITGCKVRIVHKLSEIFPTKAGKIKLTVNVYNIQDSACVTHMQETYEQKA